MQVVMSKLGQSRPNRYIHTHILMHIPHNTRHIFVQALIKEAEEECKRASIDVELKTEQAKLANLELSKMETRLQETKLHAKSMLYRSVILVRMYRSSRIHV